MKEVEVKASSKTYTVYIGSGLIAGAGERIRAIAPKAEKAAIITDDNVDGLYGAALALSLEKAGLETVKFVLPHGEESKNGLNYLAILSFLAQSGLSRTDVLVALGGGMVGDIGAFSAATYLRGINYVQMPTSLLAMVDSSVGGKTAIDLPAGKNLAGVFCQPDAVLCDLAALDSLPENVFREGCAEVLKYGVLEDAKLFEYLAEVGLHFDREYVIHRCIEIKRDYVCADEFDTGVRRKLNLGHTFGHAVEKLSGFALSHGESVAIGTAVAAKAAAKMGYCTDDCAEKIEAALKAFGLPTETNLTMDEAMPIMLSDKKRAGSLVNIIIPENIGRCAIEPMDREAMKEFFSKGL